MKSDMWYFALILWSLPAGLRGQAGVGLTVEPDPVLRVGGTHDESPEYSFTDIT